MPPALFVALHRLVQRYGSLFFLLPRVRGFKPRPNSMPLTAGILKMACAMVLSRSFKERRTHAGGNTRCYTLNKTSDTVARIASLPYGREDLLAPQIVRTGSPCLVWRWGIAG